MLKTLHDCSYFICLNNVFSLAYLNGWRGDLRGWNGGGGGVEKSLINVETG